MIYKTLAMWGHRDAVLVANNNGKHQAWRTQSPGVATSYVLSTVVFSKKGESHGIKNVQEQIVGEGGVIGGIILKFRHQPAIFQYIM
ncbi:MAG: hypothetical protein MUC59_06030 [Saprospiraceae bacterium]|nr:hypothetical protein [Saprospiraceae bacterium]